MGRRNSVSSTWFTFISLHAQAHSVDPLMGGLFTQSPAGWRWSFYLNLVAGGVIVPIYLIWLPRLRTNPESSGWERIKKIDFIGATLFAGAFMSGIMAISFGGATYPWSSGPVIGLFCCSIVLWTLFAVQQKSIIFTTKVDRLFPVHAMKTLEMWVLIAQTAAAIAVLFIALNYVPLYYQFIRGESALSAAVDMLPLICASMVAILIMGSLMPKTGYYIPRFL